MLEELLAEIQKGGTLQPAVLAARLDVSAGLVEMMLADLERRGLLSRLDASCGDRCGGCSLADSCGLPTRGGSKLWVLAKSDPKALGYG